MNTILTSSLGGSVKIDGKRIAAPLLNENGMVDKLKKIWPQNARIMIICADPEDYEKNDSVRTCFKEAFPMSGLDISVMEICDGRNLEIIRQLEQTDVLILMGGHVPTQNRFIKQIGLREKLKKFDGIVLAWSAGSMNCAKTVYACPELKGEAVDPGYDRWIQGLGLTEIMIFPHYQLAKEGYLDGFRLMEDIVYPDSRVHGILALNDGSYLMIEDGVETIYGEAYLIKDGKKKQICVKGAAVSGSVLDV